MSDTPSTTDSNGNHRPDGRFVAGNKAGKGNPYAKKVADLRAALFEAVTPADLAEVVKKLTDQAKGGDVASIKELLQRLLGPPESADLMERLEAMEQRIQQLAESRGAR